MARSSPSFRTTLPIPFSQGLDTGNSPSQSGLLLMYTDGKAAREADFVTVTP